MIEGLFQLQTSLHETIKCPKNRSMAEGFQTEAVTIEMAVASSDGAKKIARRIGCQFSEATGNQRETFRLVLRLSLAVQNSDAARLPCNKTAL